MVETPQTPPRIGVGIHFRVKGLTPELFTGWCFDNIGEVQTSQPDLMISGDHDRGVFFSYAVQLDKLRIGVFGALTQERAWAIIHELASRFVAGTGTELSAIEQDLFEEGKGKIGHWLLPVSSGTVVEVPIKQKNMAGTKAIRWN